jgi:hypothetical protein
MTWVNRAAEITGGSDLFSMEGSETQCFPERCNDQAGRRTLVRFRLLCVFLGRSGV